MATAQKQIEKLTKDYTTALVTLVREQVMEETRDKMVGFFMNGSAKPTKRKVAAKKKNGKTAVSAKRSPEALERLQQRVLQGIDKNPGSTAEELAESLRIKRTKDMALPIKKLLDENKIRKTGERRSTQYYPKKARKK